MKPLTLFATVALAAASASAQTTDFIDTSMPDRLFNLGVRIGMNTSVNTLSDSRFNVYNKNAWGTGFEAGVIADIHIRDYISLQPGFFIQTRSGDYTYLSMYATDTEGVFNDAINVGHYCYGSFTIPVVGSFHTNITDNLRWNIDFGPCFSLNLAKNSKQLIYPDLTESKMSRKFIDFGFKMGSSLTLNRRYSFGIHYFAGCTDVWKNNLGGRNKAWSFTLGYDF